MRHKGVRKEETRQKIVEAAGRGFRSRGFDGIGVDALAKKAGVTSGAFYTHFASKEAAFGETLRVGLGEVIEAVPSYQREHGIDWVRAFAEYYLGRSHRRDVECGCAMAALGPEVVRSEPHVHAIYEKEMRRIVDLVSRGLAGGSVDERRARAWAMLSVLIGGLTVARGMKSTKAADEVAEAVQAAAIHAAGRTKSLSSDRSRSAED